MVETDHQLQSWANLEVTQDQCTYLGDPVSGDPSNCNWLASVALEIRCLEIQCIVVF